MKTRFKKRQTGASMTELGLLVGLIAILLISSLSGVGTTLTRLFGVTENALGNAATGLPVASAPETPTEDPNPEYASCKEWSDAGHSQFVTNGINPIYPNGASTPINVYCQGAKTLILAQYEDDPVTDWNEGIQADYDPTLATEKGFALSTSEIPSHSKIYFGQDLASPAYCLTTTYSTGNLDTTLHAECDTPTNRYYLHRDSNAYMAWHNPDNGEDTPTAIWNNTLTLELAENSAGTAPENNFNWAFSPMQTTLDARGFAYFGTDYHTIDNSGTAWTVWVE